jgi:hypothetical protein
MSLVNYLSPAVAVFLGVTMLGETPGVSAYAGLGLILKGAAMHLGGDRLGAEQEAGADLHTVGAEHQRRGDAASVRDPAGGDDGYRHRVDHLRHQGHRADLSGHIRREEHGSMATGFGALSDHDISTVILQPSGLVHGGRRRQDRRSCRAHTLDEGSVRHAELKADHRRPQVFNDLARGRSERCTYRTGRSPIACNSQFGVVRREHAGPLRVLLRVVDRHPVTEEIEVDRSLRALADLADLAAYGVGVEQRARQRSQTTGASDLDCQRGVARTGHRRLDDGHLDPQGLGQSRLHLVCSPQLQSATHRRRSAA